MKINQEPPPFTPITITLTTREEAEALWDLMNSPEVRCHYHADSAAGEIRDQICQWFEGRLQ